MLRSASPLSRSAICAPITAPIIRPGARLNSTRQSTPPRRWCARADDRLVKLITPSEVPMATCMTTAGGTPSVGISTARIGTMVKPPPTPNSPAMTPATTPVAAKISRSTSM